jgi:hypothetical protein
VIAVNDLLKLATEGHGGSPDGSPVRNSVFVAVNDLRRDLREVTRQIRPDWDLAAPGLRENGDAGDHSMHHPYHPDHSRSPSAADSPSAAAVPGGA